MKSKTNLTNVGMEGFEASIFVFEDGSIDVYSMQVFVSKVEKAHKEENYFETSFAVPTLGPIFFIVDQQPKFQKWQTFLLCCNTFSKSHIKNGVFKVH